MTPKEKAEELVNKYHLYLRANLLYSEDAIEDSIQCALIAVDELIQSHYYALSGIKPSIYKYWQEVKKEIENL